ncbi:MAG: choline dehydrogenase [Hyphomonadaceae bacterium]|nr:choline dehydrogenase [Hyphomonadaceae bacterium]
MREYDYVIVGAGSAGCVLANRLSADAGVSVCLIEAGKKDTALQVRMPAAVGMLIKDENDHNWGFHTAPQAHMEGRKLWWPRGRGWGGSSSINGMIYIRGHARDYDQWRQMGLTGWGYSDVLPYFKRSESYSGGESAFHGGEGPLHVTQSPLDSPLYSAFIEAGRAAGHPVTEDFNGAQQAGMGPYQRTIHEGERWSASFGYLRPIADARDNLTVISTGMVTRVLVENGRAVGVELVEGKGRQVGEVRAAKEVLVCAGAIQSPQLLMLSGIGPAEELKKRGIAPVLDAPGVGANLQDHLDVVVVNEMTQKLSAYSKQKGLRRLAVGIQYLLTKSGPGADNFLQAGAFLNSREGLDRPDLQLHFINAVMIDHGREKITTDGFTLHACQLRPESRGTITLQSADPFDHPVIDPNYLATEEDRRAMRESVKLCREIVAQAPFDAYRGAEIVPGGECQTDAEIDAYIRETGETIYHPVGTVAMGADERAPLDGELRLRGIDGLRVVDASVMPNLIGGNTNAPTIMIAEKAADMILGKPAPAPAEVDIMEPA